MVTAQLDFGIGSPDVHRPSLTLGLNGTSRFTAALKALMVSSALAALTPSSFSHSSGSVAADTLVMRLMRYSSRSRCSTFLSNTCQQNCPGCIRITRPYLAYV